MAQKIIERFISPETERRLGLTNAQACRTLSTGSSWTRLRIGLRWSIAHSTYAVGTVGIFVGVTNGVSNVWASASCNHALGVYYDLSAATSITNAVGIGNGLFVKRVGTTNTTLNAGYLVHASTVNAIALTSSTIRNCCYVIELVKKAGNIYAANAAGGTSGSAGSYANKTPEQMIDAMLQTTIANCASSLSLTNSAGEREATAGAVDEGTNGSFDSVCVYWRNPTYFLELADVMVARIE